MKLRKQARVNGVCGIACTYIQEAKKVSKFYNITCYCSQIRAFVWSKTNLPKSGRLWTCFSIRYRLIPQKQVFEFWGMSVSFNRFPPCLHPLSLRRYRAWPLYVTFVMTWYLAFKTSGPHSLSCAFSSVYNISGKHGKAWHFFQTQATLKSWGPVTWLRTNLGACCWGEIWLRLQGN